MADEQVTYGIGAKFGLKGKSAQILELQSAKQASVMWSPEDKRALEIEVRVHILDFRPVPESEPPPPIVRWSMRYGHGQLLMSSPQQPTTSYSQQLDAYIRGEFDGLNNSFTSLHAPTSYIVPARGLVLRVAAREIELLLDSPAVLGRDFDYDDNGDQVNFRDKPPYETTKISVSFCPVHGLTLPMFPRLHVPNLSPALGDSGNIFDPTSEVFPPEAREWRIRNAFGQPFEPADPDAKLHYEYTPAPDYYSDEDKEAHRQAYLDEERAFREEMAKEDCPVTFRALSGAQLRQYNRQSGEAGLHPVVTRLSDLADWTPIPVHAYAWSVRGEPVAYDDMGHVVAEYR